MKKDNVIEKILVAVSFVAVIATNYLANALPLGGVTTGEASDSYPNLFTPAGITFSIWGLIYFLLLGYTIHQFNLTKKKIKNKNKERLSKIRKLFVLSSIANVSWIFAWHNGIVWLSVIIMLVLLISLIKIADVVNNEHFSSNDKLFVQIPFSVYFGWITVATIANITVLLVSLGWNGFGLAEEVWTIIILVVGSVIGIARIFKDKNIYYGAVLVWAYTGILIKHLSKDGFDGQYRNIVATVAICIGLFVAAISFQIYKKLSDKRS